MNLYVVIAVCALFFTRPCSGQEDSVDEDRFWAFASVLREASGDLTTYESALRWWGARDPRDVARFWAGLQARLDESRRWDVWAVGAIAGGQLRPGFFEGYQIWLVLQGREFYEAVLREPPRAVERIPADEPAIVLGLPFLWAAQHAYERRTGRKLPDLVRRGLEGEPWSWRELPELHPDLWQTYFLDRDRRPTRPDLSNLSDDDVVWAAIWPVHGWVDIYDDPEYFLAQYRLLNSGQRLVHSVRWMESEVMNGGTAQFFSNSTGIVAAEALRGLEAIGAKEQAEHLARVMAAFPGGAPSLDRAERETQMRRRWPDGAIDDEFPYPWKAPDLEPLLAKYVRERPDEFFRSGE